jgi:hypothetical protein
MSERRLIYDFVELPDCLRRQLAIDLKVYEAVKHLHGVELNKAIVKEVIAARKIDEFRALVAKCKKECE